MGGAEKRHRSRDARGRRGAVPVELGPGILWDVALREFGSVVGQQACNTETLKKKKIIYFFFKFCSQEKIQTTEASFKLAVATKHWLHSSFYL